MGEYPEDWNEIAKDIKERAAWKCELCGHPHDPPAGYTLTVHHLDANTKNNQYKNLVAFCQRCHLKYQNSDLKAQGWLFGIPKFLAQRL